jgi:hypothetical protein
MKFIQRLGRFLRAGLFVAIAPRHFDFEISGRHKSINKR